MGQLLGLLNIAEASADKVFVSTLGQKLVYDAVKTLLDTYNAELRKMTSTFIERETSEHKFRYKLPGGGRLQRRGGQASVGAVKATGSWDVAFPLEDFGAAFGGDEIALAYMSAGELDRHLQTIMIQDTNTVRYEILKALLNSAQRTFLDEIWGSLAVEPLANGDSVVYPPVLGSESEATEQHYNGTNYTSANISDTNNPCATARDELEEHFGAPQGGSNIACFFNPAQVAKVSALATFDALNDYAIRPGANVDTLVSIPAGLPGRIFGRASSCWCVEWRWIPADYMLSIHLDAPKPLIKRLDPPETGLGSGLQLVAKFEEYPLEASTYRNRFGFGAGNRLSAAMYQFVASTSYTTPTGY